MAANKSNLQKTSYSNGHLSLLEEEVNVNVKQLLNSSVNYNYRHLLQWHLQALERLCVCLVLIYRAFIRATLKLALGHTLSQKESHLVSHTWWNETALSSTHVPLVFQQFPSSTDVITPSNQKQYLMLPPALLYASTYYVEL